MRTPDTPKLPPLDLLLAFEAAARHLSFTRAAAERFVTQSAISRQIRALEDALGVPLFQRQHRALALTAEGQRLFAACSSVIAQLRDVVAEIRAPARREVLSLTTTPGLASLWLIPRLPGFTKAHPGVDVRLDASFERRALAAEGFDIAIRYGRPGSSEGVPLFAEVTQPVCAPSLLAAGPPLATPADLAGHTLLQIDMSRDMAHNGGMPLEWAPWLQAVGLPDLVPASRLTFTGYGEVITAALAGQGVALGRRPLIDTLIASGQLVTPFADRAASPRGYLLVVEPAARHRPAVRALERWLLDEAAAALTP
jgi:LysR family transcriptional regulator, glycine cleavage system transcriptional activator